MKQLLKEEFKKGGLLKSKVLQTKGPLLEKSDDKTEPSNKLLWKNFAYADLHFKRRKKIWNKFKKIL